MFHDQVLKTHTREVLYEKFRTEKLLARRATQKIGEEQAKRLLEGVFSPRLEFPAPC
jgi:septin family protein